MGLNAHHNFLCPFHPKLVPQPTNHWSIATPPYSPSPPFPENPSPREREGERERAFIFLYTLWNRREEKPYVTNNSLSLIPFAFRQAKVPNTNSQVPKYIGYEVLNRRRRLNLLLAARFSKPAIEKPLTQIIVYSCGPRSGTLILIFLFFIFPFVLVFSIYLWKKQMIWCCLVFCSNNLLLLFGFSEIRVCACVIFIFQLRICYFWIRLNSTFHSCIDSVIF